MGEQDLCDGRNDERKGGEKEEGGGEGRGEEGGREEGEGRRGEMTQGDDKTQKVATYLYLQANSPGCHTGQANSLT